MRRRAGFSLIELLVVIAIILVLMALLLSVTSAIVPREKRILQANQEVRDLKAAAEAYQQDFMTYPPDTGAFPTGDTPDTVADPDAIFKCLSVRRKDPKTGATGGPYYTFKDVARLKGPKGMTFVDPWGNPYQLDAVHHEVNAATGDVIRRGEPYPAGGDTSRKTVSVKVWSFGPDGKDATGSNQFEGKGTQPEDQDNIDSWTE